MGQKCRKYAKARKNGIVAKPVKNQDPEDKNRKAFREKCRKIKGQEEPLDAGSRMG